MDLARAVDVAEQGAYIANQQAGKARYRPLRSLP